MTATNHVATGALIGAIIVNPWLAIPLSFFGHFALDALPHYNLDEDDSHSSRLFLYSLAADFGLAFGVLLAVLFLAPTNWPVILACAVACASPDLMWFRYWMAELKGKKLKLGKIASFHSRIQRYARHSFINLGVEIIWFIGAISALVYILKP